MLLQWLNSEIHDKQLELNALKVPHDDCCVSVWIEEKEVRFEVFKTKINYLEFLLWELEQSPSKLRCLL